MRKELIRMRNEFEVHPMGSLQKNSTTNPRSFLMAIPPSITHAGVTRERRYELNISTDSTGVLGPTLGSWVSKPVHLAFSISSANVNLCSVPTRG